MNIAILADIHSNIHALKTVLARIRDQGVDMTVCAGDIVGYGAFPRESCRMLEGAAAQVVLGNHDRAALDKDTSFMNPYAAKAVLWTAGKLDDPSRRYLNALRPGIDFDAGGLKFAMYHGSFESISEYVYEEDVRESMLVRAKADILILGHTHLPYVKRFGGRMVVNPGSVGQPRDGDPRASFGILDTDAMRCEIFRMEYDIDGAANAIDSAGLPTYLADRLYMGR